MEPTATGPVADCVERALFDSKNPSDYGYTIPQVSENDWVSGPSDAYITIIEYADYQCPYCAVAASGLSDLLKLYPDTVRLVYRVFPLSYHDKAMIAAQAAEAAGLQGKFWEMHDIIFEQDNWYTWTGSTEGSTAYTVDQFIDWIKQQAKTLRGLDYDQFVTDLTSEAVIETVTQSQNDAINAGIKQTPSLFIYYGDQLYWLPDDNFYPDTATLKILTEIGTFLPNANLKCPAMTVDTGKSYTATLTTDVGDIVIKLYADKAPVTVNSFISLANQGWFDNVPFHRVIADFVAQTGDPTGTGAGGPGYEIKDEINSDLNFDKKGMVGMANGGANTNGSQFFITLGPVNELNGKYTVFGEVIEGLDVLDKITLRNPSADEVLAEPTMLLSVTITEN